jgi:hypothetical protein
MKEILERHNLHSKNLEKLEQPSLELQVGLLFFALDLLLDSYINDLVESV